MICEAFMKSIKGMMLVFSISLVLLIILGVFGSLNVGIKKISNYSMQNIKAERMKGYDDSVKFQIQSVISLLNSLYEQEQAGILTKKEAQDTAINIIKKIRYGDDNSGYFWIDNTDYILVAHPILPQNEGQNRLGLKDKNGISIIQEILKVVNNNPKGGFSEFYFTKSDGVTVAPKRTYSMKFEPWNWIISSGNYYDDINAELAIVEKGEKQQVGKVYLYMLITLVIIFVVSIISSFFFATRFSKPIENTVGVLQKMTEGNLSVKINETGKDRTEIGKMQNNVNAFASEMRNMICATKENIFSLNQVAEKLNKNSEDISCEIAQISNNSVELTSQAKLQHNSVSETVSSIDQMNSIVEELSNQISEQNDALSQSSAAVEEMISNISSITENVDKFGNSFKKLASDSESGKTTIENVIRLVDAVSEESAKLFDMNKIIESVAAQTNLLAMNAAIEAAHAGEAGKGFAVVAEEIRKLSESSTEQSHSIKKALSDVIDNIKNVTAAANNAGSMFGEIVNQISTDDALITEIRSSMEEQNVGSRQIVDALSNIKDTTSVIINHSKQMNGQIENVAIQAQSLEGATNNLQTKIEEIAKSTEVINEHTEEFKKMANENREFGEKLSEQTEKYTV